MMVRRAGVAFSLSPLVIAIVACSAAGSNRSDVPLPGSGATGGVRPAGTAEFIAVPFGGSNGLARFDAGSGKLLALIAGKRTKLNSPLSATTDSAGNLYAVSSGKSGVSEFAGDAKGNVAPIALDKRLTASGIAGDGTHVYLSNSYTGEVSEYAADPLGSAPIATLSGKNSTLCGSYGIAVDATGDLYVTQQGSGTNCTNDVLEFAPLKAGDQDAAPIRTIAGSKTLVNSPLGIAVDGSGNIYVADVDSYLVLKFGPSQKGNVKPDGTFGTGVFAYAGVAVDASNQLFASAPTATDYYGQIDVFDATKPAGKPEKTFKIGTKKQRSPGLIGV